MMAGFARLAGLEELDDAGQTAGDVLGAGGFARDLGQDVAGEDLVAVLHHEVSAGGHEVALVAFAALDDDGGLALLVGGFGDHQAREAGDFVDLFVEGDAFLQVLELDGAGDFREDGEGVGVPLAQGLAELDLGAFFDLELGAVDDGVALLLAALVVDHGDGAVAVHGDQAALLGADGDQVDEADGAGVLGFEVRRSETREAVPPMWKVRMVSWVPGSPMDCAAMTPTASPISTILPEPRLRP